LGLKGFQQVGAKLHKSLAYRTSLLWTVCCVANARNSMAIAALCALHPIPNQGARYRGGLFSFALGKTL
jgi:hypothetical protein